MPRPAKSEHLFIDGPAGPLECIVDSPIDGERAGSAVICHPHPQHGGTMQNKVAHTLARAFVLLGYTAMRFNFRGTGASAGTFDNGSGEVSDALAAVQSMRERVIREQAVSEQTTASPLWLAGFSFGAAVAIKAATAANVSGLISIAPAMSRIASADFDEPTCPWLIIQGDADELVDVDETIAWVNGLQPGPQLRVLLGAEHFFHGRLVELRGAISEFVLASDASK